MRNTPPFFDGHAGKRKMVSMAGQSAGAVKSREQLLEEARREREARQQAKKREGAAIKLQSAWRGHTCRKALRASLRKDWAAWCAGHRAGQLDRCATACYMCLAVRCVSDADTVRWCHTRATPDCAHSVALVTSRALAVLLFAFADAVSADDIRTVAAAATAAVAPDAGALSHRAVF